MPVILYVLKIEKNFFLFILGTWPIWKKLYRRKSWKSCSDMVENRFQMGPYRLWTVFIDRRDGSMQSYLCFRSTKVHGHGSGIHYLDQVFLERFDITFWLSVTILEERLSDCISPKKNCVVNNFLYKRYHRYRSQFLFNICTKHIMFQFFRRADGKVMFHPFSYFF